MLLVASPAAGQDYWLPRLPVTVRVQPELVDGFCASQELVAALKRRTFLWTLGPHEPCPGWEPDFLLRCSEPEVNRLLIRLARVSDQAEIYQMKVTKVPPEENESLSAALIAQTLAEKRKVIEPALREYKRGNQYVLAERGAQALQAGQWKEAATYLGLALESDLPAGAIHYGLALAHAKLGIRERATWHYLAYLEIEHKDLDEASQEPLEELLDLPPVPNSGVEASVSERLRQAKELAVRFSDQVDHRFGASRPPSRTIPATLSEQGGHPLGLTRPAFRPVPGGP